MQSGFRLHHCPQSLSGEPAPHRLRDIVLHAVNRARPAAGNLRGRWTLSRKGRFSSSTILRPCSMASPMVASPACPRRNPHATSIHPAGCRTGAHRALNCQQPPAPPGSRRSRCLSSPAAYLIIRLPWPGPALSIRSVAPGNCTDSPGRWRDDPAPPRFLSTQGHTACRASTLYTVRRR